MTDQERIAALEQELGLLKAALAETMPILEGKHHALVFLFAQIAALVPNSDQMVAHVIETAEVSTLYSNLSDKVRESSALESQHIYALLRAMRRDLLEGELKNLPE